MRVYFSRRWKIYTASSFEEENTTGIGFKFVLIPRKYFYGGLECVTIVGVVWKRPILLRRSIHWRGAGSASKFGTRPKVTMAPSPSPPPLSPFSVLRHLIHVTSVTCRQNTTFARHDPPGALKKTSRRFVPRLRTSSNARGISMYLRAHARTRSQFVEFALYPLCGANLHFRWTRQQLLFRGIFALPSFHYYPHYWKRERNRNAVEDDLPQPSRTHRERSNGKLLLWEYLGSRASLDSTRRKNGDPYDIPTFIVSLATRCDADDENGESLRRGQAPFFARSPSRYDRGPPICST